MNNDIAMRIELLLMRIAEALELTNTLKIEGGKL